MYYINFDYNTPFEDIQECMGFNPDGTINIKYTFMTLKNKLIKNINLIDKLLDNHEYISNLMLTDSNKIEVNVNNKEILESFLNENVIIDNNEPDIYDNDINENLFSDEETNQERLNMLNNIINTDDSNTILNKSPDTTESSTEEIISDEKNIQSLLNKYKSFTKNLSDDDSNND